MSNLELSKANRTKVINSFPTREIGKEGDIIISRIRGKGYFLCTKVGNSWYSSNKLNELKRLTSPKLQELEVDSLKVNNLRIKKQPVNGEISLSKGNLTLDVDGDIELNADGGDVTFKDDTAALATINGTGLKIDNISGSSSSTSFLTENSGVVEKRTIPGLGAITALNNATANELVTVGSTTTELDAEANLTFDGTDLAIAALGKIYFDGGGNTYIYEASADILRIVVGGNIMMVMDEKGDDGNEVSFGESCVGFTQLEPTYDASITVVDFRHSNKQFVTFGSGNITNLSMFFPLVSGNFQVLIKQDGTGSRTITNYRVYEFNETLADGETAVKFAGGSNPTLTTDANHVDILSFYWDADNEIAYGVATLDFQF